MAGGEAGEELTLSALHPVGVGVGVLRPGIAVSPTDGRLSAHITNDDGGAGPEHPDFALLVLLRNHAARIAAVVEAGWATVDRYEAAGLTSPPMRDLRAALLALDGAP